MATFVRMRRAFPAGVGVLINAYGRAPQSGQPEFFNQADAPPRIGRGGSERFGALVARPRLLHTRAMIPPDPEARHKAKMANRKAAQDAEVASKTIAEKGLLIVHTGAGKGKSTAAFGLALRALGYGWRVGVVQFIKGAWESGERRALERFADLVECHAMGEGFTWETQDRARDVAAAGRAWDKACAMLDDPDVRLVVLDELNIALRYDYLPLDEVLARLGARRVDQHVIVTGRNAKPEMIAAADLVTDMTPVKHHFAAGVKAQQGIEF